MSLTNTQRVDAYRFFTIAFGAAPGAQYFKQLESAYGAGMSTSQVVNAFTTKEQFYSIYSPNLSNFDFANLLIENVVGNSATSLAKQEAKQSVETALQAGLSRGDVIYNIFNNIANKPANDAKWANVAKKMNNQVEVGKFVSEYWPLDTKDLTILRNAVKDVSHETDVSTVEKIKALINKQGINLSGLTMYSTSSERIDGSEFSDYIDAGSGNDTVYGNAGNDVILGGPGNDTIYGGWGQDYIEGGEGADRIELGSHYKTQYISGYYDSNGTWVYGYDLYTVDSGREYAHGGDGSDTIYGGYGSDSIFGGEGNDYIEGDDYALPSYIYNALSSEHKAMLYNDFISGDGGKDTIYGNYGHDTIFGGEGDDSIYSGQGNDFVDAGAGADYIYSESGSDTIFGMEGNDNINVYSPTPGQLAYISGGEGDDNIYLRLDQEGQLVKIDPGAGADKIEIRTFGDAQVEIDLAESQSSRDIIEISWYSDEKPYNPVVINNFSLAADKINIGYFDSYNNNAYWGSSYTPIEVNYNGSISKNWVQAVSNTTTSWMSPDNNSQSPDSYGKGVFIIKGAAASSTDLATVANFLDPYGNNATYGESDQHIFIFDIISNGAKGIGVYQFKDDTGANNKIVGDELAPIAFLAGLSTEQLSATDNNFFLI